MHEKKLKNLIKHGKLKKGKYLNYVFEDKTNMLHWAAFYNKIGLLKKIIKKHKINRKGGKFKSTPLFFAAYNSNYKCMLYLIKNGANLKSTNALGYNLLHLTAKLDDILGYLFLKKYGVPENQKNLEGLLPIHVAQKNNSENVLTYLNHGRKEDNLTKIISFLFSTKFFAFSYCISIFYANVNFIYFFSLCILKNIKNRNFLKFNLNFLLSLCIILAFKNDFYLFYKSFVLFNYFNSVSFKQIRKNKKIEFEKLILQNKFNLHEFCVYCLDKKKRHCKFCKSCFDFEGYHCFFLGKCVSFLELPKILLCFSLFISIFFSIENSNALFLSVSLSVRFYLFFIILILKTFFKI
ncbi:ankyrin repeat-containing [Tubulinosema ratisbonensis]|uniref:Ankyrin repeat-containing n=1 Tax=Tubulinosema ratisbonensis TaxID=291195 RepID=A0A437ALE6_9MICR|nr:ankyrin repeat-containing [Tubulinosema ratisbonensis]